MARDKIHYIIRRALEKDGWIITADPYILRLPDIKVEVDLEAKKVLEFEKNSRKILVEIKSFTRLDVLTDFYKSNGQYNFYRDTVEELELEHELYLAISTVTYFRLSQKPTFLRRIAKHNINLLIVNLNTETIAQWIN